MARELDPERFAAHEEPFFLNNAIRWSVALCDAGGDVVMSKQNLLNFGGATITKFS